jgi:ferredoxin-NADP reductase
MTALQLFASINAALLLQLVAGLGVFVWRRRALAPGALHPGALTAPALPTGAWPGWRDFRVIRREFEDAARTQCSFYLQATDGAPLPAFRPGQYLTFSLQAGDKRSLTRCYSLSDRPDLATYRITVKRMPAPAALPHMPPGAASNYLHDNVQEGDVLKVRAPSGHFFIDPDASVPVVLIAGGIGITPMMSMLRWCVAVQPEWVVHLFYGVRNGSDHAFKETLQSLARTHPALQLHVVYSSPQAGEVPGRDYQHPGYVDLALLRASLPLGPLQFYVCGPPAMMQSLVPALREWGVREADIHFEAFGPASVRPAESASNEPLTATSASLEIALQRSGRTLVWSGQDANLLDFAERHGVAVDSGCRSGRIGWPMMSQCSRTLMWCSRWWASRRCR